MQYMNKMYEQKPIYKQHAPIIVNPEVHLCICAPVCSET